MKISERITFNGMDSMHTHYVINERNDIWTVYDLQNVATIES